ncbi:hypothetical protein WDW37_16470, partial [Bdellovibrionota bacterium FG-1]
TRPPSPRNVLIFFFRISKFITSSWYLYDIQAELLNVGWLDDVQYIHRTLSFISQGFLIPALDCGFAELLELTRNWMSPGLSRELPEFLVQFPLLRRRTQQSANHPKAELRPPRMRALAVFVVDHSHFVSSHCTARKVGPVDFQ